MRSVKLLLKKLLLFSLKMALVSIPAVVASYCSYRAGMRDSMENYRELAGLADKTVAILDRQSRIIERMRGEMDVLKMLASARTGAGFPALPPLEHLLELSPCPNPPSVVEKTILCSKRLTTTR
jgi:hypothetical protein